VAWVATNRLAPGRPNLQLVASPAGGLLGGLVLAAVGGPAPGHWAGFGLVVGLVLGLASRSHDLIVTDVSEGQSRDTRPLKSTMLFGFGFALAVALQLQRWIAG